MNQNMHQNAIAFTYYNKLLLLPDNIRTEIFNFMDFMLLKYRPSESAINCKSRQPAGFLNIFTIKPDFDEPLDCFNDYIPQ